MRDRERDGERNRETEREWERREREREALVKLCTPIFLTFHFSHRKDPV